MATGWSRPEHPVAHLSTPAPPDPLPAARTVPEAACKLCLIGAPGVGKTSLAHRVLRGQFPPAADRPGITVVAHRLLMASGESVPIMLWDVAGHCALDTLNQAFLSGVDAVAAVADATSMASIELSLSLLAQVRHFYPDVCVALLLNKRDLTTADVALPPLPPDVVAFEVSARDGRGVDVAFADLVRRRKRRRAVPV